MAARRAGRSASASRGRYPGEIRIIGGTWRGRKLAVPSAEGLRPTPDRVRETLFNWLAPHLPGARCLDLFAGTGALCLEALSRGAGEVVMVERDASAAANLRSSLAVLGAAHATVIQTDATEYLSRAVEPFDIVFVDPPFASDLIQRCAALIAERGWLRPGGLVYVEAPARLEPLPVPEGWLPLRSKRAGEVGYHLLRVPPLSAGSPEA